MNILRTFTFTFTFTFTCTVGGLAQRLTVEDAVRLARDNNPAFRRVLNDAFVADAEVRRSVGALLPSLNARLDFSGFSSSRVTGEDDYGQPVRLPSAIDFKGSSAQQGVSLGMTLFDGGASLRGIGAARAASDAIDARIRAEAARLTGEVTRQYYAALRAARLIAVEKQLLASAQERLERTERLLSVAGSSPVDVLGARAEVASQEQQVARAENEARKQALLLKETMGLPGDVDFELASDLPTVIDPASISRDAVLSSALANNPTIHQADAVVRAAGHRLSAASAARFPSVSASAGFGRSMSLSSYDALFEMNPQNHAFSFGISASVPLFNNFRTSLQIAQAHSAESDAQEDARETRLRVERQMRSALFDLENSYKLLQLAERKAELSRERLDLAQEQYRNGAMSFTELQNVIDRTAAAEREVVDARFGYATARTFLEEYSGVSLAASK
ncbi:MAG: TolC family protein [Gemmatimonadota bacterium]